MNSNWVKRGDKRLAGVFIYYLFGFAELLTGLEGWVDRVLLLDPGLG